jgi:hypothetical protein
MGEVYRARYAFGREVAINVLPASQTSDCIASLWPASLTFRASADVVRVRSPLGSGITMHIARQRAP